MARTTGRSGFKMKSSPTKGKLGDFFSSLGKQLKAGQKERGIFSEKGRAKKKKEDRDRVLHPNESWAAKQHRLRKETKDTEARRLGHENRAAQKESWKADAEYYGSAEDKAKNSEANRIESEEPKSKGNYHTFSGKKGDKFKYRFKTGDGVFDVKKSYEFQRPGSDVWETSKTEAGGQAIHDLYVDDYEGQNIELTPIQKRSGGYKMPGYGNRN
jgi:hypothetical protein